MDQRNGEYARPSKSQRKREMSDLLSVVKELELLSQKELEASLDQGLKQKIIELQRISKESAKKRQRQHIVKFLSKQDKSFAAEDLLKVKDARITKNIEFRDIEVVREKLMVNPEKASKSLKDKYPEIDLKRIKILVNLAQQEGKDGNRTHYRKLFKILSQAKKSVV